MNENTKKKGRLYSGRKRFSAYVKPELADKFTQRAKARELSDSAFLEKIIALVCQQSEDEPKAQIYPEEKKRVHAFTAHLTEGEAMRLQFEAARHGMKASPFIALILRGVLTKTISLSEEELEELRKVRSQLSKIGSNLNQAVKALKMNPYGRDLTPEMVESVRMLVEAEREFIQNIMLVNLKSWANLYGESQK